MRPRRSSLLLVLLLAAPGVGLLGQGGWAWGEERSLEPVRYTLSFDRAARHEADITVEFAGLPERPLEVRIARSSPGRYALHEFAKNLRAVRFFDGAGRPLGAARPAIHAWRVEGHDGTVRAEYVLYGNRADGTYVSISGRRAVLNAPATYLWARGLEHRPVEVRLVLPAGSGWRAATQLTDGPAADTLYARDLATLLDSPLVLGRFTTRRWRPDPEIGATFRLMVDHDGSEEEVDDFARRARSVVREEMAIFAGPPPFDTGRYTFIAVYGAGVEGDGMEHRDSTILTSSRTLAKSASENLATLAHEFFHAWNVERLRPAALEPFDFERINACGELWFAEGVTSYCAPLALARAGEIGLEEYARRIARAVNRVMTAPGRLFGSVVDMSRRAPLFDSAVWVDPVDKASTWISYYTWGHALGLALDLALRERPGDRDLDGYLRLLWETYGRSERPYREVDLRRRLGEYAGEDEFAARFFDRFVVGREVPDYRRLLAPAGLLLRNARAGKATLGAPVTEEEDGGLLLSESPRAGTPLARAGLAEGDRIERLDGAALGGREELEGVLVRRRPGDVVRIDFVRDGCRRSCRARCGEQERYEIVPYEEAGREVSGDIERFRRAWLGSKAAPRPAPASPTRNGADADRPGS